MLLALAAGALIFGYRELWSLVRTGKLPPVDERVRENIGKSVRNGFVFFSLALVFTMLLFTINKSLAPDMVQVLGGLLLSGGAAYLISYVYYDRAGPGLDERRMRLMKTFLMVAGISLGAFIISAFLHNILSGVLGVEEPVFFIIAVILAPLAFVTGIIGSLVIFIRGLVG